MKNHKYPWGVTGDFARLVYSRHSTRALAERAAKRLARKWGESHPGSEPRVVELFGEDAERGFKLPDEEEGE